MKTKEMNVLMSKTKLIHYVPEGTILPVESYTIEEDGKTITISSNYKGTLQAAKLAYEQDPLASVFGARIKEGLIGITLDQAKELIVSLQSMVDFIVPPVVVEDPEPETP